MTILKYQDILFWLKKGKSYKMYDSYLDSESKESTMVNWAAYCSDFKNQVAECQCVFQNPRDKNVGKLQVKITDGKGKRTGLEIVSHDGKYKSSYSTYTMIFPEDLSKK